MFCLLLFVILYSSDQLLGQSAFVEWVMPWMGFSLYQHSVVFLLCFFLVSFLFVCCSLFFYIRMVNFLANLQLKSGGCRGWDLVCINPVLFDTGKQWEQVQTADFQFRKLQGSNKRSRGLRIFPEA